MKTTITGSVAVVSTTITPEELRKIERLRPELLTIKDKDGNDLFRITEAEDSAGCISEYGAEFAETAGNKLTVTIGMPGEITEVDELKDWLFDLTGVAKGYIEQIERAVAENISAVKAAEKSFLDSIEVQ